MFEWSSLAHLPLTDVLLFAPAGAFAVAALAEAGRGYRGSAWTVALVGGALALVAEVAHGALGLPIDAGAVLAHTLGVAGGAVATAVGLPRVTRVLHGRGRPGALLSAYAVVLLLWALRPFTPETSLGAVVGKLSNEWWIPLRFLGRRVDMFSVVDVVSPFFLYLPLGALLAVWPLRRRGALSLFWPGVYFGDGHRGRPGAGPGAAPRLHGPPGPGGGRRGGVGRDATRGLRPARQRDGPAPGLALTFFSDLLAARAGREQPERRAWSQEK